MSWTDRTLPADWKRRRATVLERDRHRCQLAGPRCVGVATEVDHAQHRDDHRLTSLRAVCHPCHASRTAQQSADSRAARRYRAAEPPPGLIR